VQTVLLTANMWVSGVERLQLRYSSGCVEQMLRVHWITETMTQHGHRRQISGELDMWLPPGTPSPNTASKQPGGDVWLNMAKAILMRPAA